MNTIVAAITVKKDNTNLQTANSINTNTIVEKKQNEIVGTAQRRDT